MTYSSRQLYCLNAMGLVAWTCKQTHRHSTETIAAPEAEVVAVPEPKRLASDATEPEKNVHLPQWATSMSSWPLNQFSYRGVLVDSIGPDTAPLIVVCLHAGGSSNAHATTDNAQAADAPMSRKCMQLFDLMMRSIGLTQTGVRLCTSMGESPASDHGNVGSLLAAQSRAVLLLDSVNEFNPDASASEGTRLSQSQLPMWRIPHPQLLLDTPQLKRLAWQNLKALKQSLSVQVTV